VRHPLTLKRLICSKTLYDQVTKVISCAGDLELANRLHQFLLLSEMSSHAIFSIENDEIAIANGQSPINNRNVRRLLEGFLASNDDLDDYSLTNIGELFTIGILRKMHDLDCTNYLEKVIKRRVRHSAKLLKDKRLNPSIARGHKAAIRILRTTPRDEDEIRKLIESKHRQLQEANAEQALYEIEALDWLLTVVRLQNVEHCRVEIV